MIADPNICISPTKKSFHLFREREQPSYTQGYSVFWCVCLALKFSNNCVKTRIPCPSHGYLGSSAREVTGLKTIQTSAGKHEDSLWRSKSLDYLFRDSPWTSHTFQGWSQVSVLAGDSQSLAPAICLNSLLTLHKESALLKSERADIQPYGTVHLFQ